MFVPWELTDQIRCEYQIFLLGIVMETWPNPLDLAVLIITILCDFRNS